MKKMHIAPQYIDKQKRVCWIVFTIFSLPSWKCWFQVSFTLMNLDLK